MSKLMAPCIFVKKCPHRKECIHSKIHEKDIYCGFGDDKLNTFHYHRCPKCVEYTGVEYIAEDFLSEKEMSI